MGILEQHVKELNWPQLEDKLFSDDDSFGWMNACLDILGREEKFYIYASGYKKSADIIYNNLDSSARHHDILVYPIVFLIRQSIELLLKDIIITCYKILCVSQGFPKHHLLIELWREAKSNLQRIQIDIDKNDLLAIKNLLDEFENIDPFSSAFRYPEDKEGNESLPGRGKIDIQNFMQVSKGMYNFLEGINFTVAEYYDDLRGSV